MPPLRTSDLLFSMVGARRRNNESMTHALRRLAADMNYSTSAVSRAVKSGRVSDRMHTELLGQLKRESSYTQRTVYFSNRLLSNAKGKRLSELQTQATKDAGKFRKRVATYRKRTQANFGKRLNKYERELVDDLGVNIDDITNKKDTPRA